MFSVWPMDHEDCELVEILYDREKKALIHVFKELLAEFPAVSIPSIIDAVKTVRRKGVLSPYATLRAAREVLQERTCSEASPQSSSPSSKPSI
jgi:hypothetical protein